jgi:hypothetical protein
VRAPGAPRREAELGPGLHLGVVEMAVKRPEPEPAAAIEPARAADLQAGAPAYRVRLRDGRRFATMLAPGVAPSFIDACMREGRAVVLAGSASGVVIEGALQTTAAPAPDARGALTLEARHLRIRAEQTIALEVPGASLRLEPGGAVRLEGDRLVIDMAALVRIFSTRVEVP